MNDVNLSAQRLSKQVEITPKMAKEFLEALTETLKRLRATIFSVKKRKGLLASEKALWLSKLDIELKQLMQLYSILEQRLDQS